MSQKIKAGRVCSIRINPRDCMSVCDAIEKLKLDPRIMTFDQAVRVTLSSALESLRQAGTLPERDGFEYSAMLARFRTKPSQMKGKLEFTKLVDQTEAVRALVPSKGQERRRARFQELRLHYEADPINHPKPQPGTPDYEEWEGLVAEFFSE